MLRLLSSKAQECKRLLKPAKPCHVIHLIALTEYSQMSTHVPGFQSFFSFFNGANPQTGKSGCTEVVFVNLRSILCIALNVSHNIMYLSCQICFILHTRNAGTGSSHFNLLIAHLKLLGTHLSLAVSSKVADTDK